MLSTVNRRITNRRITNCRDIEKCARSRYRRGGRDDRHSAPSRSRRARSLCRGLCCFQYIFNFDGVTATPKIKHEHRPERGAPVAPSATVLSYDPL